MLIYAVLIVVYLVCSVASLENRRTAKVVYIAVGITLTLLAALRPEGVDNDYAEYVSHFNNYDQIALLEPTFKAIAWFSHTFLGSNYIFLFAVYAVLGVTLKFIAIRELSNFALLSVAIYISQFFILHEMTQIRAGIASSFMLLSIKPLFERNWRRFLLYALCATAFHLSGVIILALWFINPHRRLKIYLLLIPAAILIYLLGVDILGIIPIPYLSAKIAIYQNLREYTDCVHNHINLFNSLYLVRLGLCYLLFWAAPTLRKHNRYFTLLLKIYTISLAAMPLFAPIPVVAFRTHELLGIVEIILVPTLVFLFRPTNIAYLVVILYGFCLLMISLFYNRLLTA